MRRCYWLPVRCWKREPMTGNCHMPCSIYFSILCFACVLLRLAMASVNTVCLQISAESLPISFDNEIVDSSELRAVIRSNIICMADVNKWVAEFGRRTHTHWNCRSSLPAGKRIICSKIFVCHRSSFMKVAKTENKRGLSKNSECPAIIKVIVKLNTNATRKKDPFIKRGLFGVIVIYNAHTHSLGTDDTLRFLPAEPALKETFLKYFSNGMGIAESCHYHKNILELQESCIEVNFANGRINPSQRTVQNWHDQWRLLNLGPHSGAGLIEEDHATNSEKHEKGHQEGQRTSRKEKEGMNCNQEDGKHDYVRRDSTNLQAWQGSEGTGAGLSSTLVPVQTVIPVATATTGAYSEPQHVLEAIQQVNLEPELILKVEPYSDEEMPEYDRISSHREGVGGNFHRSESSVVTPSCVPSDSCASASTPLCSPALQHKQEASNPLRSMKRKRGNESIERIILVHERLLESQVDIKSELTEIRKGVCKISDSLEKLVKLFDKRNFVQ